MSESKFLPFQDVNGDGLNDDCKDQLTIEEPKYCPTCIPNASALVPDWRQKTVYEPFLNEKNCKFQIAITARKYTTTGAPDGATEEEAAAALKDIYKEYEERVITALLESYGKDTSAAAIEIVQETIEYTDYWLEARHKSRLRLLYSVPFETLEIISPAEEEEEEDVGGAEVTYTASMMSPMMLKVRKSLNLYTRYLKVYRAIEGANVLFLEDNRIFNLENYGDFGFGGSILSDVLPQLDAFLQKNGYNIANVRGEGQSIIGGMNLFTAYDTITEITFTFNEEYEIQQISFYTEGCGEEPITFVDKCKELRAYSAWRDRTAMAYFAQLLEMEQDLMARVARPWLEFIEEYTYPTVYGTAGLTEEDVDAGSCIGDALAEEGKQLGQDILDEVFSLGDAIAYIFHTQLCKESLGEDECERVKIGEYPASVTSREDDGSVLGEECDSADALGNMHSMALEQAFQTLEKQDNPFNAFCARLVPQRGFSGDMLGCIAGGGSQGGAAQRMLDDMWEFGWDDIKICGLFDLLMEALQCLFGGLTLEEALSKMIEAALRAMSINNVGELFGGLSPEKQAEISALVEKNLANGDIFKEDSHNQALSDTIATGETSSATQMPVQWTWPWDSPELSEEEKNGQNITDTWEGMTDAELQASNASENRTLAQQFDASSQASEFKEDVVLEAIIRAYLEVYGDDLLGLADELNKFPGAQLISNILATLDCPRPPIFQPGLLDWIKDIELPFCRDLKDINWPRLQNPFGWLPKIKDILRLLFQAIKCAIQMIIIKILVTLIIKLCELIGNAICNALEALGDVAASLPDLLTGKDTLSNVIKESICGEDADDQLIDDTIVDLVAQLGVGGAALADREQALQFAEDMSASLTQTELTQALLGEATDGTLVIIDNLIEYEYPEYRAALPNKTSAGSMLSNMGNLMPAAFRDTLRDYVDQLPANDTTPANPSICLDPEKLDTFKELRCQILEGRATPEQCEKMFDNMRGQMGDDLGDIALVMQSIASPGGLESYLAEQMPPMVSDPGCDNGIMPYEPAVVAATVTKGLGNDLEQLKMDYATDMLGNGPTDDNWGLVNMMLSDTMGNPLTTHMRKAQFNPMYKDFYSDFQPSDTELALLMGLNPLVGLALMPWMLNFQRGAYPTKMAAYLQETMSSVAGSISVDINNEWQPDETWRTNMATLGFDGLWGQLDLLAVPDQGYNVDMDPYSSDGEIAGIEFTLEGRKADPDISLRFEDNAKGLKTYGESEFSWGFDLEVYMGDLEENEERTVANKKSDNMRIVINERVNLAANLNTTMAAQASPGFDVNDDGEVEADAAGAKLENNGESVQTTTLYEFLSVDNTLAGIDANGTPMSTFLESYPNFMSTFENQSAYTPQSVLLKEIIETKNAGLSVSTSDVETLRGLIIKDALTTIMTDIADVDAPPEESSWNYGAQFDNLSVADLDYGIDDGGTWVQYSDTEYTNKDMILGISFDQFKNDAAGTPENTRVYYLDPVKFGGNYMRPPLYVKPIKPIGWMGIVDVFFPELSACKPETTDIVDFGSIQQMIDEIYPNIPEDERLKSDPDCVVELPYNRIMERPAKAAMLGLIKSSIRIFASVHMIKALPTFTKFSPKFPEVFSTSYASYIIEDMEESFRDVRNPWWVLFNTFKDDEFWYGFLEQCVQTYGYLADTGKIDPPQVVLEALFRLNDMQEKYDYPNATDLKEAKEVNDAGFWDSLEYYRLSKNLEAVRATEEDAKIIMTEMVVQELNFMARQFMKNMGRIGMVPEIHDLDYYLMEVMTQDSTLTLNSALNHNGSFKASYGELPMIPYEENEEATEPYYTNGGELVVEEAIDDSEFAVGQEYIGFYHVTIDEDTELPVYMVGEYHMEDEPHDTLRPFANIISVAIGNINDYGDTIPNGSSAQPFLMEKYISIDGTRYSPSAAVDIIQSHSDTTQLLSDVYPGSMKLVLDDEGEPVGIEGEIGVRYGIVLGLDAGATGHELTSVEIDALDLPLSQFKNLTNDSMLLLCLINHLKEDEIFKLVSRYIFPLNKLTSVAAIYNDMAILPSIGELTVEDGATYQKGFNFSPYGKPGAQAIPRTTTTTNSDGEEIEVVESVEVGPVSETKEFASTNTETSTAPDGAWSSKKDREPGLIGGIGVMEWDNWDQALLVNSSYRIRKLFDAYYNARDFDPGDIAKTDGPGAELFKKLRDILRPAPGRNLLPWWNRRKLRSNPFNANGELCD